MLAGYKLELGAMITSGCQFGFQKCAWLTNGQTSLTLSISELKKTGPGEERVVTKNHLTQVQENRGYSFSCSHFTLTLVCVSKVVFAAETPTPR